MADSAFGDETVLRITENASWLPSGGRAYAFRGVTPPRPMSIVRLLIRRADDVFCVVRTDSGRLDLPMRVTQKGDPDGLKTISALAEEVTGRRCEPVFVGAVRNVVDSDSSEYPWPRPVACFGLWTVGSDPVLEGAWVRVTGDGSPLQDKHWYPIVS